MDNKEIIKLVKNAATTAEQLGALIGVDVKIDRLLAKHPNATGEILEKLSESDDKTVCRSVVSHPNIRRDTLVRLAQKYPTAFFKNPALEEILSKDSSIPLSFERESLREILFNKDCPDCLGNWTLGHGDDWLQAAYVLGKGHPLLMLEKFRESNYPQVISALLHFDDASYLQWAKDLGYEPSESQDEETDTTPRAGAETYIEQLIERGGTLFRELVPVSGEAESLQGELLRTASALQGEYWQNLFMNWGNGSNYYQDCLAFIQNTLLNEESFSPLVKKIIEADLEHIRFIAEDESYDDEDDSKPFRFNDIEDMAFPRLDAVIAFWCEIHQELISFKA